MQVFTKNELINQLKDMMELAKKCSNDMMFHAEFSFSGLDPKFMELARQFNVDKAIENQKALKESEKRGKGNI